MTTNTSNKELEKAIFKLCKDEATLKEAFIIDELQKYMDLSNPSKPEWIGKVRLRLKENIEAEKQGYAKAQDEWMNKILPEQLDVSIKEERKRTLKDVERVMSKLILPERKLSMNDTTYKYYLNDWLKKELAKLYSQM